MKRGFKRITSMALTAVLVLSAMLFITGADVKAEETPAYADFEMNVSELAAGTYSENIEKNGITILASAGSTVTIDKSSKKVNNVSYTLRLKTGGTGTPDGKSVKFTTQAATTVSIVASSSSGNASRVMGVGTLVDGAFVDVTTVNIGTSAALTKVNLPEAGTYYLYSKSGGINFYDIAVSYASAPAASERVDDELREEAPDFKAGDIYVSTKGSATASGSFADPMDLVTALNTVQPGSTIWMFSGTYYVYDMYGQPIVITEQNSGTADALKTVSSINGKKVTVNFDGMAEASSLRGIVLDGSYWHFYGIDICNAGDNGMLLSGDHNKIELCQFYGNHDTGLQLSRYNTSYASIDQWPSYNLILNCTSFNNKDDATSENADGFAAKLTCGEGNVFDGCISYCNSDDGWDLYAKTATGPIGVVTIRNCVAFGNGKLTNGEGSANGDMNGFKLGGSGVGTPHVVENCLAFLNGATGFTDNNNPSGISLTNCTAAYNGAYDTKSNFNCYRSSTDAVYTNLVSLASAQGSETDQFKGTVVNSLYHYKGLKDNNAVYWVKNWLCADGSKSRYTGSEAADYTVTAADFVSVTVPGYDAAASSFTGEYHKIFRNQDGSINLNQLFEIKESSKLYTAGTEGTYVGCSFSDKSGDNPGPTPGPTDPKNGLLLGEDGAWHLYQDGAINTAFTGLACNEHGWFYVKNGTVDWTYSGVTNNEHGWWRVENGRVNFNYTGIAQNEHGWWRIENGKVNFDYTGVAQNEYGWWYLSNGKVDFTYNGLACNEHGWWKIADGAVDFGFTGIATNEHGTWVVRNGKVDFTYNGGFTDNGILYFVQDGKVKMKLQG